MTSEPITLRPEQERILRFIVSQGRVLVSHVGRAFQKSDFDNYAAIRGPISAMKRIGLLDYAGTDNFVFATEAGEIRARQENPILFRHAKIVHPCTSPSCNDTANAYTIFCAKCFSALPRTLRDKVSRLKGLTKARADEIIAEANRVLGGAHGRA